MAAREARTQRPDCRSAPFQARSFEGTRHPAVSFGGGAMTYPSMTHPSKPLRPETPTEPQQKVAERIGDVLDQTIASLDAADLAIVVAHPDDESIGCGAQLPRWHGATLVMMTDGSPRNPADARALGFETAEAYATARRRE